MPKKKKRKLNLNKSDEDDMPDLRSSSSEIMPGLVDEVYSDQEDQPGGRFGECKMCESKKWEYRHIQRVGAQCYLQHQRLATRKNAEGAHTHVSTLVDGMGRARKPCAQAAPEAARYGRMSLLPQGISVAPVAPLRFRVACVVPQHGKDDVDGHYSQINIAMRNRYLRRSLPASPQVILDGMDQQKTELPSIRG
jgi:hypothetical protein